jgi:hypothetical protein
MGHARRGDIFPDDGPEYEKPEDIESEAERMRRLNRIAVEDAQRLFEALTGRPSNIRGLKG